MQASDALVIRPALDAEYERLGELTVEAYLADGFLVGGLADPYADQLRDVAFRAARSDVLVAAEADRLLGGVTFALAGSGMTNIAETGESEIRMLAVAPEGRGRGLGTALAEACLDRARAADGVKRVVLSSLEEMETAHRIYERLGFARDPQRDWSPLPDFPPLWVYSLDLD
jgi:ribosomal protein S18 acetylase RimI-like enzyme